MALFVPPEINEPKKQQRAKRNIKQNNVKLSDVFSLRIVS